MAATNTKSSRFISGFGAQVLIAMVAGLAGGRAQALEPFRVFVERSGQARTEQAPAAD